MMVDPGARLRYSAIIPDPTVIHVIATERAARPELESRLAAACSDAVRPSRCQVVEGDDGVGESATVTFTTPSTVQIAFRDATGQRTLRGIEFRSDDRDEDRWQAIGLLVASMSSEAAHQDEPRATPPSAPAARQRVLSFTVGGDVGDGLAPGPARFGGFARFGARPRGWFAFFTAGAGFATSPKITAGVRPTWLPLFVGVGGVVDFDGGRLSLRPRLDLLLERQGVAATASAEAGVIAGSRWLPGVGTTLELVVPGRGPVSVSFAGTARFMTGGTAIHVHEARIASFPAHGYGMAVGVEVSLDALFGTDRD
jgi:hypothetical protein